PIGTGPYIWKEWRDRELKLEANLSYWGGSPNIGHLLIREVPGHPTIVSALADTAADLGAIDPFEIDAVKQLGSFKIFEYPSYSYSFIAYNLEHELFSDLRVRQALAHAIDREAILTEALN